MNVIAGWGIFIIFSLIIWKTEILVFYLSIVLKIEGAQTRRMYGHDYAVPGTYEVTMVVTGRQPVFGEIVGTTRVDGEKPHLRVKSMVIREHIHTLQLSSTQHSKYSLRC